MAQQSTAAAQQSAAAAEAAGDIGEIVVTAQRRSERLMDVPMSIEAFGQEKLDQEGLRSVDDLARVAPGVTFLRNGMSSSGNYNDEDSDISIRGIDSTAGASTTGIYVDDTPIQTRHLNFGTVNPYPALFDLDRVEVSEGPAGHALRGRIRGRDHPVHHARRELDGLLGLRACGVRPNRRRRPELRGRRRVRRPDHRRGSRLPRQRLVPRGRRLGGPRELHGAAGGAQRRVHHLSRDSDGDRHYGKERQLARHADLSLGAQMAAGRRPGRRSVDLRAIAAHQRHRRLLAQHLRRVEQYLLQRQQAARPEHRPVLRRGGQGQLGHGVGEHRLEHLVLLAQPAFDLGLFAVVRHGVPPQRIPAGERRQFGDLHGPPEQLQPGNTREFRRYDRRRCSGRWVCSTPIPSKTRPSTS